MLEAEVNAARSYAEASRSPATRRAYASDWKLFAAWCIVRQFGSLPAAPAVVALFVAAEAQRGIAASTIERRLAAIGYAHRRAGELPPQQQRGAHAIFEVVAGIRRTSGTSVIRKAPASAAMTMAMLGTISGDGVRARRDRAVIALGLAGAFRRSELANLRRRNVAFVDKGLRVTIRRSKTDQDGAGVVIAIPEGRRIRSAALLRAWLDVAGATDAGDVGPLFRQLSRGDRITAKPISDRFVARLVQRCAAAAGYDQRDYAGHSLRAGFLTEAAKHGVSVFKMRDVSRHKSLDVLAVYVRDAELFDDHAGEGFL